MRGVVAGRGQRHLVGPPGALHRHAVDHLGAGPALGRTQHDHRPLWTFDDTVHAGGPLDLGDLVEDRVQGRGQQLVHRRGVVAGDEVRPVARTRSAARVSSSSPIRASTVGLAIL